MILSIEKNNLPTEPGHYVYRATPCGNDKIVYVGRLSTSSSDTVQNCGIDFRPGDALFILINDRQIPIEMVRGFFSEKIEIQTRE